MSMKSILVTAAIAVAAIALVNRVSPVKAIVYG